MQQGQKIVDQLALQERTGVCVVQVDLPIDQGFHCSQKGYQTAGCTDLKMEKTQPVELAAIEEVACATHPCGFTAAANHIGERVSETLLAAVQNRACLQSTCGGGNDR